MGDGGALGAENLEDEKQRTFAWLCQELGVQELVPVLPWPSGQPLPSGLSLGGEPLTPCHLPHLGLLPC